MIFFLSFCNDLCFNFYMWLFGVFLHLAVTDWRFAFGRVGGTKSCQHEANAGVGYEAPNLHITPPDVKPVLTLFFISSNLFQCFFYHYIFSFQKDIRTFLYFYIGFYSNADKLVSVNIPIIFRTNYSTYSIPKI